MAISLLCITPLRRDRLQFDIQYSVVVFCSSRLDTRCAGEGQGGGGEATYQYLYPGTAPGAVITPPPCIVNGCRDRSDQIPSE